MGTQLSVNTHADLSQFEDQQILPVIWMEVMSGEISEELRSMIYHSTFSANAIQLSFKYGTLLVCVASLGMLVATLYYSGKNRTLRVQQENIETLYQLNKLQGESLKLNEKKPTVDQLD